MWVINFMYKTSTLFFWKEEGSMWTRIFCHHLYQMNSVSTTLGMKIHAYACGTVWHTPTVNQVQCDFIEKPSSYGSTFFKKDPSIFSTENGRPIFLKIVRP